MNKTAIDMLLEEADLLVEQANYTKEQKTIAETGYASEDYGKSEIYEGPASEPRKASGKGIKIVSDVLFYLVLLIMIFTAFAYKTSQGSSMNFFGYSFFHVKTGSMQNTIPKGSFIVVKKTNADAVRIGDDITFYQSENTIVTHRVIEVDENYQSQGVRAFKTKGTNNPTPDKSVVYAVNVIGVVRHVLPKAGFVVDYLSRNLLKVIIFFVIATLLSFSLRVFFGSKSDPDKNLPA